MFHPMLKHGDLMNEARFPSPEGWPDVLKNPSISLLPNTPTGEYDNL
jgi:hypothetical protein